MKSHAHLIRAVHRVWSGTGFISTLLLPLSWLTRMAVRRKATRYTAQSGRVWHSTLPVVIVGNIYVGGTGKTPVVMALVDALIERGWRPGVISRGYGVRIGPTARTGHGELDPGQFGDEPALIAKTTHVPVSVHPVRVKAAQALMHAYPAVNVIVADDGLQHLALGRDAEVIVQDTRGVGNGRLLPAGPLREPAIKLAQVDVVVTNNPSNADPQRSTPASQQKPSIKPVQVTMTLAPFDVIHVDSGNVVPWEQWRADHLGADLSAVAAIGHPERFFDMLRQSGLTLNTTLALPDHTAYSATTFDTISSDVIVITTKDAVKCRALSDKRLWAVRVKPHFSNTHWIDTLHNSLIHAAQHKNPDCASAPTLN